MPEFETGHPVEVQCEQIWGQLHRDMAESENMFLADHDIEEEDDE